MPPPNRIASILLAAVALAAPAAAAPGNDPAPDPRPPAGEVRAESPRFTPRQEAERDYGDAYREIAKAKDEIAKGKKKNAEKRFTKALERAARAVERDTAYFEAWNLVGYAARGLGDYDRSLAAYSRCLALNPDYMPAREYLGEAYVDLGRADEAREQLDWLVKFGTREQIASLRGKIEAFEAKAGDGDAGAPASEVKSGAAPPGH